MSQLVFQTNAGGIITFTAVNTASGYAITVPAASGTLALVDGSNNLSVANITASGNLSVAGTTTLAGFTSSADGTFLGTGEVKLPAGTTAQRSGTPAVGMIRYNSDYATFEGYANGAWGTVGGGATGGGNNNQVFVLNDQTVTTNYTIPSGKNASTAGAITINTGIVVTVSTGSRWVIV